MEEDAPSRPVSKSRAFFIITCITCITGNGKLLSGLLTVVIPVIARDLLIPADKQLWPTSALSLACGCTLIPFGAAVEILGYRRASLFGGFLQAASVLGTGLGARHELDELIALCAMAGLAASFCLPSTVGVAGLVFPANSDLRQRSIAFASMGGGQCIGLGLGLVLGGVFTGATSWRWAFYMTAILNGAVIALGLWALPRDIDTPLSRSSLARLARTIDWVGALLISASLSLLSFILAVASGPSATITLLALGAALLPAFALWVHRQTRLNRPALIPNHMWRNPAPPRYFHDVRGLSTLTSAFYFLPAPVAGLLMSIAIGVFLPYLRPAWLVPAACSISGLAPLLLACLCRVNGPGYWHGVFQAMALNPVGADLIYTIANLVTTAAFPANMEALAGGVFNTLAQIGKSVWIASSAALLMGYRAGWWYNCALGFASIAVNFVGLRKIGRLEVKRD
ncbi:MFS general substrate transporter [Aspergillus homomorphus CBS 101889]|uniref:MFS general substrate transporter n=1 Tax=Aspergillus homomorphus (strain CBS 101889) TaxID=1450537 RepID=A0A395HSJ3_ASPHC|nr:MFS general substrate transporter [Aspergillus homomorphus CBS 101889]RAL10797.1 MFS general substrate transporter [Aspergillus homomorphus CBS 101889]